MRKVRKKAHRPPLNNYITFLKILLLQNSLLVYTSKSFKTSPLLPRHEDRVEHNVDELFQG
jgi:hypothetical protein